MVWKTLDDIALADQTVLVRVDINVPLNGGEVGDNSRIARIVPTVRDILAQGGRPVLMAHFDRPRGQVVPEMSLRQVVPALQAAFPDHLVRFATDCIGAPAKQAVRDLEPGEILLLENTRFHPGEEKNDPEMAAALAALGDIYVNDAFSVAHRAHASTAGIARLLPAVAGRLMQAEMAALEAALDNPARPVAAVVGGAKVSTKLELLGNLATKVNHLVIGGAMANTFLAAQGHEIGRSLTEAGMAPMAREILEQARAAGCTIHLPLDVVIAPELVANAPAQVVAIDACLPDCMILDAGPATVAALATVFADCRTLIWNGPLGAFETPPFDAATVATARRVAELTTAGRLISVAGGGDTVAALRHAGVVDAFSYVSAAGGAFLEWMEGRTLPGVAALHAAATTSHAGTR